MISDGGQERKPGASTYTLTHLSHSLFVISGPLYACTIRHMLRPRVVAGLSTYLASIRIFAGPVVDRSRCMPAYRGSNSSTFRLKVSTFHGTRWVISLSFSEREIKGETLLRVLGCIRVSPWPVSATRMARVELRSG